MTKPKIIDSDVHNAIANTGFAALFAAGWHEYWMASGPGYGGGWYSPIGVLRG